MQKYFLHFLIAGVTYYLAGRLGLLLAIPPGFASAVWPASGLALACALLLSRAAVFCGVGAGSFLLNLGVASQNYNDPTLAAVSVAAMISLGAMLQCAVGVLLFRKLIGAVSELDIANNVLRFLSVVAPLGCLIAATIGVSSLYIHSVIAIENIGFSWLTWWLGDTIGILLFTPLTLSLFSPSEKLTWPRKAKIVLPPTIIFTAVLLLFFNSLEYRRQAINNEVQDKANYFFQVIEERLRLAKNKLDAYVAYYAGTENVTREEFDAFSRVLLEGDTIFQGVGWTEIIPAGRREEVESAVRTQGFADFHFTELNAGELVIAAPRQEYYPVLFIYPYAQNQRAFGLNLGANPERLEALRSSRSTAKPVATAPIRLAQESGNDRATIMYVPIYRQVHRPDIPRISYSREEFRGYIGGVFRISGILGSALDEAKKLNFGIRIHDVTKSDNPLPLIFSENPQLLQLSVYHKKLRFGERIWDVEFYADQSYQLASKDWASWLIIVGGFLAAAMLQAFIMMIMGNEARILVEVERKTHDLALAVKAAEEANKAKSNFLANMSHEFRTPLNAIIGLVNLCLKTPLNSKQQDYLQKTSQASETLLLLINHTLDYSKIEAGKLELEFVDFSLAAMLKKIHSIFWVKASQQNVGFSIELPPTLPALLKGDSLRLEQVVLNLCSNAFKFTQQGSVTLVVELEKEEGFTLVRFTVQDTGIGILAEHKEKLFESFQQADASTSRRFGGTGLGLSISRQLVELMGGNITVTSELGQGSSFSFQLAFEQETSAEISTAELSQLFSAALSNELGMGADAMTTNMLITGDENVEAAEGNCDMAEADSDDLTDNLNDANAENKPLTGISILLVEDVEVNQIIAEEVLKELGATITIAENGAKAVEAVLSEQTFDLVLMDIQMPEMDGYEATRRIRQQEKFVTLPIVAMTANAMTSDIEQCKACGMNDHIPKPIDEEVMLAKILANLPQSS